MPSPAPDFPSRRLAAMQPYLFPYLAYFQLIRAVDVFVLLNQLQYTKRGWINRNYLMVENRPRRFTLALRKAGFKEPIDARIIDHRPDNREKIAHLIRLHYRSAPQYDRVMPGLEAAILANEPRLDRYLLGCLTFVCGYLELSTRLVQQSALRQPDPRGRTERLVDLARCFGAREYINPIGGTVLYSHEEFEKCGLRLAFLKSRPVTYLQYQLPFVPNLSIIDVLMFNAREEVVRLLDQYDLVGRPTEPLDSSTDEQPPRTKGTSSNEGVKRAG